MSKSLYDFTVTDIQGHPHPLDQYRNRVVLIVNTASKCGFAPQFAALEELWQKYRERGLVVLGFPCNQFANQDPGSTEEIATFCQVNFGVTFPMMNKIEVNGPGADPLFQWLKSSARGRFGSAIKWNFTKFLVFRDGKTVQRFAPTTKPSSLEHLLLTELL